MKKMSMILLALCLIASCCTGAAETVPPAAADDFNTVFRFIATSDHHVTTAHGQNAQRLGQLLRSSYAYAETQAYPRIDAMIVAGDLTDYGRPNEYKVWNDVVSANIKADETVVLTVMGNHEYYDSTAEVYQEYRGEELNKHVVINGYHFIGLSNYPTEGQEGRYLQWRAWLKDELAAAAADDPEKPIITFQHHHLADTVYSLCEMPWWFTPESRMLNSAYAKYSQVINFSGHSHCPINHPAAVYQKDYTLFGTGTLSYFELERNMSYGVVPPNAAQAAQFYIVEISDDNRVRVLPYDLISDSFFLSADGKTQLVYTIDSVTDKSAWRYTDRRAQASAAPVFAVGQGVTIDSITPNGARITFPQATDDDCVYSYRIVAESGSDRQEYSCYSEFYFQPMPETLHFNLSKLKPAREYTVSIYAVDAFGKQSETPITGTFTTQGAKTVAYASKNPVTYAGAFTDFNTLDALKISKASFVYNGSIKGDVFVGDWSSARLDVGSHVELTDGGYQGSQGLTFWSENRNNQGMYIFATPENGNTTAFPSVNYLRVWVDFTGIDFRKANFGLVTPSGDLYSTDETDGKTNLPFYCLAEGSTEWVKKYHGADGCFGQAEGTPMRDFKGWLAFPVEDFTYRPGTGSQNGMAGEPYPMHEIAGVYMFWNYSADTQAGARFSLDELHLVEDYTVFTPYQP